MRTTRLALSVAAFTLLPALATAADGHYPDPVIVDPELNPPTEAGDVVIFVNFDGANLVGGPEDALNNSTSISELAGAFPSYGPADAVQRQATFQAVKADWAPFGAQLVTQRPADGIYTMVMVGPAQPYGPGVLGIAPLDCFDNNGANISYAFHASTDTWSPAEQATTISQEVAHTLGLEHVDDPMDIMNPSNSGSDPTFRDVCIQLVSNGYPIMCGAQHSMYCPDGQQNAYQELLGLVGGGVADMSGPSVSIVGPLDGAEFEVGDTALVLVEAVDDIDVTKVTLRIDGALRGTDLGAPYEWSLKNLEEGVYTLEAHAFDAAGNETISDPVSIYVGVDAPDGTSGTTGVGTDSGFTSATDGFTGGAMDSGDEGCGCRGTDNPTGPLALALILFGVRRRRNAVA